MLRKIRLTLSILFFVMVTFLFLDFTGLLHGWFGWVAWRNGRTYCNAICPVGTFLGFISRFSVFRPVIDAEKCRNCRLCEKRCKSACIDIKNHQIDYSRCVACMDCLDTCKHDALHYVNRFSTKREMKSVNEPAG